MIEYFNVNLLQENAAKKHKLTCYYWDNHHHPLLFLQPVKVEVFSAKPFIVMYHELISDKEIDSLKDMATPIVNIKTL